MQVKKELVSLNIMLMLHNVDIIHFSIAAILILHITAKQCQA